MSDEKTTLELAQEKANRLTEEYKAQGVYKVHPIVFKDPETGDEIVGYVKEPSRLAKMAVMDKAIIAPTSAVAEIIDTVLIKEHSDPRMYSESQEHDDIYLGLLMGVYNLIKMRVNTAKKK